MFCWLCGSQILDNAAFCVKCGVAVAAPPPAPGAYAPDAGRKSRSTYLLFVARSSAFRASTTSTLARRERG